MMHDDATAPPLTFHYRFDFADGSNKEFEIRLHPATLALLPAPAAEPEAPPEWTKLDVCRCTNCPLAGQVEYCPVAVSLSQVVESFKDSVSYEAALVTVTTRARLYQQATTLQRGLSSIIGIYNVTSGCPILDRLRPMVRFHLPLASSEETAYRAISTYLMTQYFAMRHGATPDWELRVLAQIYEAIEHVEKGLSDRLRHASNKDANVNAVILLSVFGYELRILLEEDLRQVEYWMTTGTPLPPS
jgi:hypothetical protein